MPRQKNTGNVPMPHPTGSWIAGAIIGGTILTIATGAVMLGVGVAIQDATLKRGRPRP